MLNIQYLLTTYYSRLTYDWLTQWVGRVAEVKRGYHILCKSTAALPYMNRPVKMKTYRHRIWSWLDPPSQRVSPLTHYS